MNPIRQLYARYRGWEDGYIAMLDALDAGRPVDPSWARTMYRRRALRNFEQLSRTERAQVRDFIWRYRGWRGFAWLCGIVFGACVLGSMVHLAAPAKVTLVDAVALVNVLVLSLLFGGAAAWFSASRLSKVSPGRLIGLLLITIVGALVGAAIAALQKGQPLTELIQRAWVSIAVAGTITGLFYVAGMALIATLRNRELRALNEKLAAEADRERLSKELAESRLRLLQAQVEPHFLFNTLGAVQQLAERGSPEAATLTGHLIGFLRGALGNFRPESTTLEAEARLIESYLGIMRLRLGARLVFTVDVPPELRAVAMRPTLLITLVENAVKHGIEPHPPGGSITVRARREEGAIVIDVADTGAGMAELPGSGAGLANVREQLRLAYGERAGLELFDNTPQGVIARLRLPADEA